MHDEALQYPDDEGQVDGDVDQDEAVEAIAKVVLKGPDGEYRYGQDCRWRHAHHHGGGGGDVAADEAKAGDGVGGHAADAERERGGYQANIQRVAQVAHERGVADDAGVVADGGDEEEAGAIVEDVDFELQRG